LFDLNAATVASRELRFAKKLPFEFRSFSLIEYEEGFEALVQEDAQLPKSE